MMLCARILTFFALGAFGFCQTSIYDRTPNAIAALSGSETIVGHRLSPDGRTILGPDSSSDQVLIRLPPVRRKAVPQLLGMLNHGADIELFMGWADLESEPGNYEHHVEIFRGKRGTEAALVRDFTLYGGPGMLVNFFQPPDARDSPAVLIDIQGGAYWGTTYILAPDRQSVGKLFTSSDYEFADLDRDGVYELIAWNRRPFDVRCMFGIFAVRFYPEVFVRAGASYRKAWPPPDWPFPDGTWQTASGNMTEPAFPGMRTSRSWQALPTLRAMASPNSSFFRTVCATSLPKRLPSTDWKTSPFISWRKRHCRRNRSLTCWTASGIPQRARRS
jgi:hypothetical protein